MFPTFFDFLATLDYKVGSIAMAMWQEGISNSQFVRCTVIAKGRCRLYGWYFRCNKKKTVWFFFDYEIFFILLFLSISFLIYPQLLLSIHCLVQIYLLKYAFVLNRIMRGFLNVYQSVLTIESAYHMLREI